MTWARRAGARAARRPPCPHPDERGAGTALVAVLVLVLATSTVLGGWLAGWAASRQQAAHAADLAALAGAQARVRGRDACRTAGDIAARNGATLVACRVEGGVSDVVVRVEAETDLRPAVGGRTRRVRVAAVAGTVGAR